MYAFLSEEPGLEINFLLGSTGAPNLKIRSTSKDLGALTENVVFSPLQMGAH